MEMGEIIKQLRKEADLTQEELGKKLDPPLNRAAINKWESGVVENIKRSYILQMAALFNVSGSYLMGFDPSPANAPAPEGERTQEFIQLFRQLTDQQRQSLIALMRSMIASK